MVHRCQRKLSCFDTVVAAQVSEEAELVDKQLDKDCSPTQGTDSCTGTADLPSRAPSFPSVSHSGWHLFTGTVSAVDMR
ncbi:UNVERIFIED_CONTAM: hypothetical protein FKN15_022907 [Acipenser sinensis]